MTDNIRELHVLLKNEREITLTMPDEDNVVDDNEDRITFRLVNNGNAVFERGWILGYYLTRAASE